MFYPYYLQWDKDYYVVHYLGSYVADLFRFHSNNWWIVTDNSFYIFSSLKEAENFLGKSPIAIS